VEQLRFAYGSRPVLQDISFRQSRESFSRCWPPTAESGADQIPGGGAVEGRSEAAAKDALKQGTSFLRAFSLTEAAENSIGMACGGSVEVLFQFISAENEAWKTVAAMIIARINERKAGWLALRTDGGAPALLDEQGHALWGEPVEGSEAEGTWMPNPCAEVFCVPLPIGERVVIFGAGHCAQALAPIAHTVGFRVTVFDEREEYANRKNFPLAEEIIVGDYTNIAEYLHLTAEDYLVIMTSGHSYDLEVQDQVLRGDFAYVGVIGSRKKTAAVNQRLRECGISEEAISKVHTPIGTAIKAVTPAEIAVSIAGEMIYERAVKREGRGEIRRGCPMHE
jgi:xanthine dehydrogenase accessory factor